VSIPPLSEQAVAEGEVLRCMLLDNRTSTRPAHDVETALHDAIGNYVKTRRMDGALPERVLVEVKALRTTTRAGGEGDWRGAPGSDVLLDTIVRTCVRTYFES
jgi:hypothetical protein